MNNKNDQILYIRDNEQMKKESSSKNKSLVKTTLFGVGITNEKEKDILEYIVKTVEISNENFYIVTPNPEMIVFSSKNSDFKIALNQAQIALCDGVGLWWGSYALGYALKQRITGVDFMKSLCEKVSKKPITVGFLGGGP